MSDLEGAAGKLLNSFVARRNAEGAVDTIEHSLRAISPDCEGGGDEVAKSSAAKASVSSALRRAASPFHVAVLAAEEAILGRFLTYLTESSRESTRSALLERRREKAASAADTDDRAADAPAPEWRPSYRFSESSADATSHGGEEAARTRRTAAVLRGILPIVQGLASGAAAGSPVRSAAQSIESTSDQEDVEQRSDGAPGPALSVSSAGHGVEEVEDGDDGACARVVEEVGASSLVPFLRSAFLVDSPAYVADRSSLFLAAALVATAMARSRALAPLLGDLPEGGQSVAELAVAFVDSVGDDVREEEGEAEREGEQSAAGAVPPARGARPALPLSGMLRAEFGALAPPPPLAPGQGDEQAQQLVHRLAQVLAQEDASQGAASTSTVAATRGLKRSGPRKRRQRRAPPAPLRSRSGAVACGRQALERARGRAEAAVEAVRVEAVRRGPPARCPLAVALGRLRTAMAPLAARVAEERAQREGEATRSSTSPAAVAESDKREERACDVGPAEDSVATSTAGAASAAASGAAPLPPVPSAEDDLPDAARTILAAEVPVDDGAASEEERWARYEEQLRSHLFASANLGGGDEGDQHSFRTMALSETETGPRQKRLRRELRGLRRMLPLHFGSSIALRVDERRPYLMRAVIAAPDNTPYDSGCFCFDIYVPPRYPTEPPKVQLMTTGGGRVRFNPNLYECGKVCLSLLGTWSGPGWDPQTSNLFQVLVSIQAQILGAKYPVYNEPGYEDMFGTPQGTRFQRTCENGGYERLRVASLRWAVTDQAAHPTPGFATFVRRHLWLKRAHIAATSLAWVREALRESDTAGHVAELLSARCSALQAIEAAAREDELAGEDELAAFSHSVADAQAVSGWWTEADEATTGRRREQRMRRQTVAALAKKAAEQAEARKKQLVRFAKMRADGVRRRAEAEERARRQAALAEPLQMRASVAEGDPEALAALSALDESDFERLLSVIDVAAEGAPAKVVYGRARVMGLRMPRELYQLVPGAARAGRHYSTLAVAEAEAVDAVRAAVAAREAGDEAAAAGAVQGAVEAGLADAGAVVGDMSAAMLEELLSVVAADVRVLPNLFGDESDEDGY